MEGKRSAGSTENISVTIRIRPLNEREKGSSTCFNGFRRSGAKLLTEYSSDDKPKPQTTNEFDHVFGPDSSTEEVFDSVAKDIVDSALGGVNGTIFAYGQTSSGKTFTMMGDEVGDFPGLLPLSAIHIFDTIERDSTTREYLVRVSFVEIYNEVVTDLLNPAAGQIKIRESRERGVFVEAKEEIITNFEDLMRIFAVGSKNRHVGATRMNDRSSRSHTIFRITIESKERPRDELNSSVDSTTSEEDRRLSSSSDIDGAVLVSTLSLVDLAGSENARNTGAQGVRLREGGNINKSLLCLSSVIKTLSSARGNNVHVRFRDSKLTRLLQPSLVGNCRTGVICCITPASSHAEETRSTLRFAGSAKTLTTCTRVNEVLDDAALIRRLKRELGQLRRERQHIGPDCNPDTVAQLTDANKMLQEQQQEAEQQAHAMQQKLARMQEITALILGGKSATHSQPRAVSKRRSKRKRETWCPGNGDEDFGSLRMMSGLAALAEEEEEDADLNESVESTSSKRACTASARHSLGSNVGHLMNSADAAGLRRHSLGTALKTGSSAKASVALKGTSVSAGDILRRKDARIAALEAAVKDQEARVETIQADFQVFKEKSGTDSENLRNVINQQQSRMHELETELEKSKSATLLLQDEKEAAMARAKSAEEARQEKDSSVEDLSNVQGQVQDLQEELSKARAQIAAHQGQVEAADARVTAVEGLNSEYLKEIDTMKQAVELAQQETKRVGQQLAKASNAGLNAEEKDVQIAQLNEIMISKSQEADKLRAELVQARDDASEAREALEVLRASHEHQVEERVEQHSKELAKKLAQIEVMRHTLKQRRTWAESELMACRDRIAQAASRAEEEKCKPLHDEITQLQTFVSELQAQLETKTLELSQAQDVIADQKDQLSTARADQQELLDDLAMKLQKKGEMVRKLQTELEQAYTQEAGDDTEMEVEAAVGNEAAERIAELEASLAEREQSIATLKCSVSDMTSEITMLKQEIASHEAELSNHKVAAKARLAHTQQLHDKFQACLRHSSSLQRRQLRAQIHPLETSDDGSEDADAEMNTSDAEFAALQSKLNGTVQESDRLRSQVETLTQEVAALQESEENLRSQLDAASTSAAQNDEAASTSVLDGLRAQLSASREQADLAIQQKNQLQEALTQKESELVTLQQTLEEEVARFKATIGERTAELEICQAELEKTAVALNASRVTSSKASDQVTDLQARVQELESALQSIDGQSAELNEQRNALREAEERLDMYKQATAALEKKIAGLKEDVVSKHNIIDGMQQRIAEAEEQAEQIRAQQDTAVTNYESRLSTLRQALNDSEALVEDLRTKTESGKASLAEKCSIVEQQSTDIVQLKQRIDELQQELQQASTQQADSTALAEMQSKIDAMTVTITEQKKRIASLEKVKMTKELQRKFIRYKKENTAMKERIEALETTQTGGRTRSSKTSSDRHVKELTERLRDYYNRVTSMKQERQRILETIAGTGVTKNENADIEAPAAVDLLVERLIDTQNARSKAEADLEILDSLQERMESLQEQQEQQLRKTAELQTAKDDAQTDLAESLRQVANLEAKVASLDRELASSSESLAALEKQYTKSREASQRDAATASQRIRFLEKENLSLMMQTKKVANGIKRKMVDKENSGNQAPIAVATKEVTPAAKRMKKRNFGTDLSTSTAPSVGTPADTQAASGAPATTPLITMSEADEDAPECQTQ